ncbi:8051_t:CDS:10 [Funneliformis caledonium]|uniref:8051_t:CDS:1 n=1 Tax=Funneliformis caledonium TaxID=1117310 RepID=A0A9N9AH93_9GLOM|nr:8051_t:CDS:10 [Funneliformis caledonium]
MDFDRYVTDFVYNSDNMEWSVLNCLKYLEARVQYTSDSKEDIIDAFARTFEKISNSTAMLSGVKRKAKKLANKVEEKFRRKEIRQEERDLENSFDKNGRELLKRSGDFNTLELSSRYMERTKELCEGESVISEQHHYGLRKKQKVDYNEERILERISQSEESQTDDHSEFSQVESLNPPKIEALASLSTKSHLENYNIVCLFDIGFPYTKQLFMKLSRNQMRIMESKWIEAETHISKEEIEKCWKECSLKKLVDDNNQTIKDNSNENTLYVDLNELMTSFTKQKFDKYDHQKNYELLWCQNVYVQMTLQLLHKHSALLDKESGEFKYRDDIVNPLLASIFYDVEDVLWMKTGEIENESRKRQRNFSKQEDDRGKLGDKHDGILYMNVNGVKIGVGFVEVVGNAFTTDISDKNYDLEKLLKATMISLYYQHAHQSDNENISRLQSFAILVFGREYHLLSMHLVDEMYIVDEYDAFIIPDSCVDLLQIGNAIEIVKKFKVRLIKYYRQLIKKTRKVTRLPSAEPPTASPSGSKAKKKSH